jgi:hypothetical protein
MMHFFSRLLGSSKQSSRPSDTSVRNGQVRLQIESLEKRELLSANPLFASAPLVGSPPAAPSFTARALSPTQVGLSWGTVASATGYLVDEWINGGWSQIGSFDSNTTGATVSGLSPNTTYYFDVAADNATGYTWADYQSVTTLANVTLPAAPSFTATALSSTQVSLSWNSVPGATSYLVDEWINGGWSQIGSFDGNATGATVNGLNPNTTYYFDVAACNVAGNSWADYQSVTTSATSVTVDHPVAARAYAPASGVLFGSNGPSFLDVQQGQEGDCWLIASLAAVAARNPSDIQSMFTAAGTTVENGTTVNLYNVRFFDGGGTAHYVMVDTELPAGGSYYDSTSTGVLWVALAEKAYAEANGQGIVTSQHVGVDSYDALNNGYPAWALQAITGRSANSYSINPTDIGAAWNSGQVIVLTTTNPASPYIVGGHAYAVVGYDASGSYPYEVLNPWGGTASSLWCPQDTKVYGLFLATAGFLSQNFSGEAIGTGAVAALADLGTGWEEVADKRDGTAPLPTTSTPHQGPAGFLSHVTAADLAAHFARLAHSDNGSHKDVDFWALNF